MIYDVREISAQQLCYDANSANDACCLCTWSCTSFLASSGTEQPQDACGLVRSSTYYHNNGSNALPIVGSSIYTNSNCEDSNLGIVNFLPCSMESASLLNLLTSDFK